MPGQRYKGDKNEGLRIKPEPVWGCECIHKSMLYCIHLWVPIKTLTRLHSVPIPTSDPEAFVNTTCQVENRHLQSQIGKRVQTPSAHRRHYSLIHTSSHTDWIRDLYSSLRENSPPQKQKTRQAIKLTIAGESRHFQTNKYRRVHP